MLWGNSTMNSSSGCILKTRHYHCQITEGWRNACGLKTGIAMKVKRTGQRQRQNEKKDSMRTGQDEDKDKKRTRAGRGKIQMRNRTAGLDEDRDRINTRTGGETGQDEGQYRWGMRGTRTG
jgi:hypothetical protein